MLIVPTSSARDAPGAQSTASMEGLPGPPAVIRRPHRQAVKLQWTTAVHQPAYGTAQVTALCWHLSGHPLEGIGAEVARHIYTKPMALGSAKVDGAQQQHQEVFVSCRDTLHLVSCVHPPYLTEILHPSDTISALQILSHLSAEHFVSAEPAHCVHTE